MAFSGGRNAAELGVGRNSMKVTWRRVFAVLLLATLPAVVAACWALAQLQKSALLSEPAYLVVCFLVLWSVMWLTAGRLIRDINQMAAEQKRNVR
jgi:inner membrane protein involved in colicin E2 resistance